MDMIIASNEVINYENISPEWDITGRHSISSVPVSLVNRKEKAYFHELDDASYLLALQSALEMNGLGRAANMLPWKPLEYYRQAEKAGIHPTSIERCYAGFLAYLQDRVKGGGLASTDEDRAEVQVVHDVLSQIYYLPSDTAESTDESPLKITVEVILYRSGKYHGKHAAIDVYFHQPLTYPNRFLVADVTILGSVFEDKIAMFPVIPLDPLSPALATAFSPIFLTPTPVPLSSSNQHAQ